MNKLYIGVFLAASFWFLMFTSFPIEVSIIHHQYFWHAMTVATIILSVYTFVNQKDRLKEIFKFEMKFVLIGLIHAIVLYGISRLGVYIFTEVIGIGKEQIAAIYQTRMQADPKIIAMLLMFLIGPSEEIFWRGFVQNRLQDKFSKKHAFIITALLYSGVHIWALNPMLLLAALVLGVHWGLMYMRFGSIVPGLISHAIWDTLIFVVFPITIS